MEAFARTVIGLIDLTDLADDHRADGIDELCRRAARHRTAAVCVWPEHVERCVGLLAGTAVHVATVVNFPSGDNGLDAVVDETTAALDAGADEIDVVLPRRALLAGDDAGPAAMVATIRALVGDDAGRHLAGRQLSRRKLKVILETGELVDARLIRHAARLAVANGADFLKTSTGKTPVGATPDAARVMLEVIAEGHTDGRPVGIKPSGGIRTLTDAATYLALADDVMGPGWVTSTTFRFGASGLLDAALAAM